MEKSPGKFTIALFFVGFLLIVAGFLFGFTNRISVAGSILVLLGFVIVATSWISTSVPGSKPHRRKNAR